MKTGPLTWWKKCQRRWFSSSSRVHITIISEERGSALFGREIFGCQLANCLFANPELKQVKTQKGSQVVFTVWHGARKHVACLRTVKSMVSNMFTGVTKVRT